MTRTETIWESPSSDPNDETFGDIVDPVSLEELGGVDTVLIGEPFDAAVIGRKGASEGPSAIRSSLAGVKTHRFQAGPVARIGDYGDVDASDTDLSAIREAVRTVARFVHDEAVVPVFLGGDNSLTVPNVSPLVDARSVGVINLDAHLDLREVHGTPTSGTPYRELFEAGLDAYVCIGARHFETSTAYAEYLDDQGGTVVTAESVGDALGEAIEQAREAVADVDSVYLSIDCDVLDVAHAPGVSAPTPGGLTSRELFRFVRAITECDRLAGVEIVECAPPLDTERKTVDIAARTVAHALAGIRDTTNGDATLDVGGDRR